MKTPQEKLIELRKDYKKLKKQYEKLHIKCISFKGLVLELNKQLRKEAMKFYK